MPREFRVRREQVLPATPEQVWNAVATGEGNLGWLYPMEIEPRVGGTVSRGQATVVEWAPSRRLACRSDGENGFSNTLDYTVEAQGDTGTRLSMGIHWVHPGSPDDGWDTRADAAERHFDFYRHSLAEYLRHFAGRPARYVKAVRPDPAAPGALTAVCERLGMTGPVRAGDTVKIVLPHQAGAAVGSPVGSAVGPPAGAPAEAVVEAVVDRFDAGFLGLRTGDALYRFFDGSPWDWPLWLGHHLYAPDVDPEDATRAWDEWLTEVAP
ncbi:SRPBCC domain-containing protein [Streptomyces sp. NBC_01275]|uniref:SRPBCC family protein n=1 Tax=Streptomyces sp. NBC_01275 TaxID=2903807 RepID=UPI0022526EEA|nr:SRPBCC domain-containing protein [Streptomyces sp. NBC_01275]MCX4765825.1 SRPBCC domain-containing protein [Streptomyces sp. NBC_01275]